MPSIRSIVFLACASALMTADAFSPAPLNSRTASTSLDARRPPVRKNVGNASNSRDVKPMGGAMESSKKTNWVPVQGVTSMADLPQEENVVKLVDTMAEQLIDRGTNPTGAVSVVNYEGKTYCFASSCKCCQIPLAKAQVLAPNEESGGTNPRVSCDFCKATYNIRTGARLADAEKPGLLGGIVVGLFSKSDKIPLPIYDLGEKKGQVLINLP